MHVDGEGRVERSSLRTTSSNSPARSMWTHASRACSATNPYGRCCRLHAAHADSNRSRSLRSCLVGAVGGGARRARASSTAAVCSLSASTFVRAHRTPSAQDQRFGLCLQLRFEQRDVRPARARTRRGRLLLLAGPFMHGIHPSCLTPLFNLCATAPRERSFGVRERVTKRGRATAARRRA